MLFFVPSTHGQQRFWEKPHFGFLLDKFGNFMKFLWLVVNTLEAGVKHLCNVIPHPTLFPAAFFEGLWVEARSGRLMFPAVVRPRSVLPYLFGKEIGINGARMNLIFFGNRLNGARLMVKAGFHQFVKLLSPDFLQPRVRARCHSLLGRASCCHFRKTKCSRLYKGLDY